MKSSKIRISFLASAFLIASCALWAQTITTFAGNGSGGYSGDGGPATQAAISGAVAVATDAFGNVFIGDLNNNRVRKVDSKSNITTIAGTGVAGFAGDGGPATQAQINHPAGLCTDAA